MSDPDDLVYDFFVINDFVEFSLTLGILPVSFLAEFLMDNVVRFGQVVSLKRSGPEGYAPGEAVGSTADGTAPMGAWRAEVPFSPFPMEDTPGRRNWVQPVRMTAFEPLHGEVSNDRIVTRSFLLFDALVGTYVILPATIEYYRSCGSAHVLDYLAHSQSHIFDDDGDDAFDLENATWKQRIHRLTQIKINEMVLFPNQYTHLCPPADGKGRNQLLSDETLLTCRRLAQNASISAEDLSGLIDAALTDIRTHTAIHLPFSRLVPNPQDQAAALAQFRDEVYPPDCPITLYEDVFGETPWAWVRWYNRVHPSTCSTGHCVHGDGLCEPWYADIARHRSKRR